MIPGLQQVVDSLSARLERSVTIDDTRLNVLAYSIVNGQVDPMRTDAILHRATPAASAEWLFSLGITRATGPVRLPGRPEFGQLPRVCVPVRNRTVLLGYLWVIDEDSKLSDAELGVIEAEASLVGQLLYQEQLLEKVQRGKENELARDLLSDSLALSEAAASELSDLGSFVSAGYSVVTVVQPALGAPSPPDLRVVLADALHAASRQFSPRHALYLVRGREGLLLTTHASVEGVYSSLSSVVAGLVRAVSVGVSVQAGIGEVVPSLTSLHASYRQACLALRVARAVPTFGPVTAFPDLGVYRILATLPSLTPDLLDAGLRRLLSEGPPIMTETLETYLDCACDSTRTAAALHIHRTTLHYRLGRIQEITGADLSDGTQRLTLHLGLKAARLALDPPPL